MWEDAEKQQEKKGGGKRGKDGRQAMRRKTELGRKGKKGKMRKASNSLVRVPFRCTSYPGQYRKCSCFT